MRRLRSVEYVYGQTPKDALSGIFHKSRRTVSTRKSMRMSRRFARTPDVAAAIEALGGTNGESSDWQSVGDAAKAVLLKALHEKRL
ncbi:hypothetical protein DLM45_08425 [Hyphomicrobium methylovorum]|nr:hypothetical protein [Hyphomicrobium methylovorum]